MDTLVILLATATATSAPAFELEPAVDLPVLAIGATINAGWLLRNELAPPFCAPLCDKNKVNAFDRGAAGNYDPNWKRASDIGVAAMFAASALTLVAGEGLENAANDAVVVGQSVLTANMLAILTHLAAKRPRPFAYGTEAPEEKRREGNASLSFPSGHTAGAFAAATSTFRALSRLHDDPLIPWLYYGAALAAATFIGVSRVQAGDHFPTDVIAGGVIGVSVGFLIPALHDVIEE